MKAGPLIFAGLLAAGVVYRRRTLSRPLLGAAVLAFTGLVLVGVGIVHLPDPETAIRDATQTLGPYTYLVVGVLAFLETGAGIGLIAPGELAVILGGVSAGQGEVDLVTLILLVWACALAGDITSYVLGLRLGRGFLIRHGPALGVSPQRLEKVERFFAAHGGKTIVVGRFIGLVRALSPFVAGTSRMPWRRFVPYTAAASGLWAATFCVLGYVCWHSLDQLLEVTKQGTLALAATVILVAGIVVLYRRARERSRRVPVPVPEQQ